MENSFLSLENFF